MKVLVVYYSYGGNTRKIAEKVAKALHAELAELRTVKAYSGNYDEVVEEGHEEVKRGYKPELLPLSADVSDYDAIVVGSPVWWYTFAPAMKTFLESRDWTGKKVYPFATNGGWPGHTAKDFKSALKGAEVAEVLDVRFDGANMQTPGAVLENWLKNIK